MKKVVLGVLGVLIVIIGVLLYNLINFKSNQTKVDPVPSVEVADSAIHHFAEAISIRTVSFPDPVDFDSTQFELFNEFLERSYPLVHQELEHRVFNSYSHLFHWKGSNPALKPIILMAHLDVVPIASPYKWSVHPFTEGIKNDTLYGRGAIDDKFGVIGILESVEMLLREGIKPQRSIYLSFGHDEELSGAKGAVTIVDYLKSQGVEAEFILDEGLAITQKLIPGIEQNVALIGVAEKGYASMRLQVDMEGGHSSTPASESSIDVLAGAVHRLKNTPFPSRITNTLQGFIAKIGPNMGLTSRLAFSNPWLFQSMILNTYETSSSATAASVRTTISPTIFEAGVKDNVIPTSAEAIVNFRLIPGDDTESVMKHVQEAINDPRVQCEFIGDPSKPSPESPIDVEAFATLERSILEIFPDVLIGPSLVLGGTDARHFADLSPNIYRFAPYQINEANMKCYHGIDERMAVNEFNNAIRFYRQLIINWQKEI